MTESDAHLIVETSNGPERVRVIRDGAGDKPDERESWWPGLVSEDGDGNCWESFA